MSNDTKYNLSYLLGHLVNNNATNYPQLTYDPRYSHHFPMFTYSVIYTMMLDPRIKFGLSLIKGPIMTYTRFFNSEEAESPNIHKAIVELDIHFPYAVKCEDKNQEEYILRQLNRFWETGVAKALKAIEWGFSGSQILYCQNQKKQLEYDNLHPYQSPQLRAVSRQGGLIGFTRDNDDNKYIPIGKGFWHVHQREDNMFYGISRLKGAHVPWHETWMLGGARDVRRTWYFRNAYDGGEIYYPEGYFVDENGQKHSNEYLAVKMAEAKRTGSTAIFPSNKNVDGKRQWEYEPAKSNMTPQGLVEYIQTLRDEELEGLGIPPEVVQSGSGNGLGSATGRMVPLMAFIASLTPLCTDLILDFRKQILDPILLKANNFTKDYDIVKIVPKSFEEAGMSKTAQTVDDTGLSV